MQKEKMYTAYELAQLSKQRFPRSKQCAKTFFKKATRTAVDMGLNLTVYDIEEHKIYFVNPEWLDVGDMSDTVREGSFDDRPTGRFIPPTPTSLGIDVPFLN